ncbi:hypothetical protein Btru_028306 [Bulinus truncatus]|nr:hypothetical protein Btru_028306 [Bulinus truncatus]
MPSAQRAHHGNYQVNCPPLTYYSNQFLPSLAPKDPGVDTPTGVYYRLVQSNGWPLASTSNGHLDTPSMASRPQILAAGSEDVDHRVDRKKQLARRQLMWGLTPTHVIPAVDPPRRTHSFVYRSDVGESAAGPGRASHESFRRQRHSTSQPRSSFIDRTAIRAAGRVDQDDTRARQAIHSWNELVQELNRRKYMLQVDNLDHLAILSHEASHDSSGYTEKDNANKHQPRGGLHASAVLTLAPDVRTDGLGVTRYRPITPNFLAGLDKKKLPSRTLTQLWVNKLPDNHRSYQVNRPKTTLILDEDLNFQKNIKLRRQRKKKKITLSLKVFHQVGRITN